jgi:hypothetical protein
MKMPKNVDLSKSINREKVIEPSIANNEKNIECPPLEIRIRIHISVAYIHDACFGLGVEWIDGVFSPMQGSDREGGKGAGITPRPKKCGGEGGVSLYRAGPD